MQTCSAGPVATPRSEPPRRCASWGRMVPPENVAASARRTATRSVQAKSFVVMLGREYFTLESHALAAWHFSSCRSASYAPCMKRRMNASCLCSKDDNKDTKLAFPPGADPLLRHALVTVDSFLCYSVLLRVQILS